MSLGRLLTSGRSLIGLHSSGSRYQMRRKNLLPRFGSAENPFSTTRPEPLTSGDRDKIPTVARTLKSSDEPTSASQAVVPEESQTVTARESATTPKKQPVRKERMRNWLRWMNPRFWFRKQGLAAAVRVAAAAPPGPVQGELSLENVKVIRNDLNEPDVEVVQARLVATPPDTPPQPADETPELIKT